MEILLSLLGLVLVDRLIVWASGDRIPSTLYLLKEALLPKLPTKEPKEVEVVVSGVGPTWGEMYEYDD